MTLVAVPTYYFFFILKPKMVRTNEKNNNTFQHEYHISIAKTSSMGDISHVRIKASMKQQFVPF